ncbi:MAG: hypothetical protein DRP64_18660, partial [Verrucomicrobia bacterium]
INRKTYAYDELSRPMLELMNYDGKWYYTTLRYDLFGRVEYVDRFWRPKGKEGPTYNLDPEWNRFTTQNTYNERGALLEVSDGDAHTWWEASAADYDEQGRLIEYQYGNGLTTTNHFNSLTGRMEGEGILDGILGLADYQFSYDRLGNLTQRSLERGTQTLTETCGYDALNRLTSTTIGGTTSVSSYDSLGNIKSRDNVDSYLYGSSRPHAVTSATLTGSTPSTVLTYFYDNNGNIVRRDRNSVYEFTANWNSFNKPTSIFAGTEGSEFQYSVDGRRTQQLIFEGTNVTKKVYATPAYEMKEILLNPAETNRANWQWEMDYVRIYVDTPAGKIGIYQQEGNTNGVGTVTRSYLHKDHLGSIVAVSDDSANLTHYSFDAWGNRRDASDWSPTVQSPTSIASLQTDRGFTGHEQLDHLQLIHMNGRIYDPIIGRMISPDPLIQAPENLQSFNRYSYVWNNPLSSTDPSGFKMTKAKAAASIAAAQDAAGLSEAISTVSLSEQDNLGGNETESSTQVDDYYTDGSGNTQVDQSSRATSEKSADPNAKNDVKGEAGNKTQFEQTGENTKTGDYTKGKDESRYQNGYLDGYDNPDDAALAALLLSNPKSIDENVEYGGLIYEKDGRYYYTESYTDGNETDLDLNLAISMVPEGGNIVSTYHTHGDYSRKDSSGNWVRTSKSRDPSGADYFSPSDRRVADEFARYFNPNYEKSYLGRPDERIKAYPYKSSEKPYFFN